MDPVAPEPPLPATNSSRSEPVSRRDIRRLLFWAFGPGQGRGDNPSRNTDFGILTLRQAQRGLRSKGDCKPLSSILFGPTWAPHLFVTVQGRVLIYDHAKATFTSLIWRGDPLHVSRLISYSRDPQAQLFLVIAGAEPLESGHVPWRLYVRGTEIVAAERLEDLSLIREPTRRNDAFQRTRCRLPRRECVVIEQRENGSVLGIEERSGQPARPLVTLPGMTVVQAAWGIGGTLYLQVAC